MILRALSFVVLCSLLSVAHAQEEEEWENKWTTDPANEDPDWARAVDLRRKGDSEGAMALYREFLDKDPKSISVIVSMGSCFAELGRLDDAERWWRDALVLVPNQNYARLYLARMLYHRGKFKEAKVEFGYIDEHPKAMREEVLASARTNLGRIALIERRFQDAERYFRQVASDGDVPRGKRNLAAKGIRLCQYMTTTHYWASAKTAHLVAYFSPKIPDLNGTLRAAWLEKRELAYARMCATLGLSFTEPITLYVTADDLDGQGLTGRDEIHTMKYSWWQLVTTFSGEPDHDLAHQLVCRVAESRPGSQVLVEGLCCVLDGFAGDPHREARVRLKNKQFPRIEDGVYDGTDVLVALHADQRRSLESVRPIAHSFVAHAIEKYGMERFLASYRAYNNVMVDPAWVHPETGARKWHGVLSEVFRRGLGEDLATIESEWLDRLR